MTDYKKALDKAVEYIMGECYYCPLCINFETCNEQLGTLEEQGIDYQPDKNICKDSIKQYFIRQAEAESDANTK